MVIYHAYFETMLFLWYPTTHFLCEDLSEHLPLKNAGPCCSAVRGNVLQSMASCICEHVRETTFYSILLMNN